MGIDDMGFEISPYLQLTRMLAEDTRLPGSEIKQLWHSGSQHLHLILKPQFPQADTKNVEIPAHSVGCITEEKP